MKAYYYDNLPGPKNQPHNSGKEVSSETLVKAGILHWSIPVENWKVQIDEIANERGYKNRDTILNTRESLGDEYDKKNEAFFNEHMHEDEEIRYVIKGSGYFDLREFQTDDWIRIHVTQGDMIVLPAGIYHRYTLDEDNYAYTLRLFKEEPKWIAYNRSAETDANPFRKQYVQEAQAQMQAQVV